MCKRSWSKGNITISYMNPSIIPFPERELINKNDIMYFYYDVEIYSKEKAIFTTQVYDFPKVQNLSWYIEQILNIKEDDMFVYENYEHKGFKRKVLYSFIELKDSSSLDMEYFYKIEKRITYVKQQEEAEYNRIEEYTLIIGQNESEEEFYGKSVFLNNLTKMDLISLMNIADEFCKIAIDDYNKK